MIIICFNLLQLCFINFIQYSYFPTLQIHITVEPVSGEKILLLTETETWALGMKRLTTTESVHRHRWVRYIELHTGRRYRRFQNIDSSLTSLLTTLPVRASRMTKQIFPQSEKGRRKSNRRWFLHVGTWTILQLEIFMDGKRSIKMVRSPHHDAYLSRWLALCF